MTLQRRLVWKHSRALNLLDSMPLSFSCNKSRLFRHLGLSACGAICLFHLACETTALLDEITSLISEYNCYDAKAPPEPTNSTVQPSCLVQFYVVELMVVNLKAKCAMSTVSWSLACVRCSYWRSVYLVLHGASCNRTMAAHQFLCKQDR